MPTFREKPIEVEAIQWHAGDPLLEGAVAVNGMQCALETPEGYRLVDDGDWVVTDTYGKKRRMKPDEFNRTHERV